MKNLLMLVAALAFLALAAPSAASTKTDSQRSASGHVSVVVVPPQANDSTTTFLNASDISASVAGTEFTVSAANPSVSGTNVVLTLTEASGSAMTISVRVIGTDQFGQQIAETLTPAAAGSSTTTGTKVFATVTKVRILSIASNAASDTMSLGTGDVIGIPKMFSSDLHEIVSASCWDGATEVAALAINSTNFDATNFAIKAAAWDCSTDNDIDAGESAVLRFITDNGTPDDRTYPQR